MASEIQKEPSALEAQSLDEVFHSTKLEDSDVLSVPNAFSGSGNAVPLQDVSPISMDNNNQTCDVTEDDGTVRKRKNSGGHCQQKKRFTCAVCGKSLSSKKSLQICGKSFARNHHLSAHKLTHAGEKPFDCRICGKTFRSKTGLRCHEKKHSEGNQSVCALCGEPFRLVDDLEKHLKWHIQGFRSKNGFRYHEKKHSEGNPSVCALCGELFRLVDDLEKHLKWHIRSSGVLVDILESDPVHVLNAPLLFSPSNPSSCPDSSPCSKNDAGGTGSSAPIHIEHTITGPPTLPAPSQPDYADVPSVDQMLLISRNHPPSPHFPYLSSSVMAQSIPPLVPTFPPSASGRTALPPQRF
ncbi:unnamed protein product [Cyprideis torosa]|uniref:Uncharacterized protein n=1 Tax=Cyprideis torosa TaxID=163714 RepID=A0A7R8WNT2_9CRUS|nr:unnamed protein product [Cyprideis torosa]CAG0899951.1 unnamed protein product [Cyprideis torosa]